jgi:hypothetical protein
MKAALVTEHYLQAHSFFLGMSMTLPLFTSWSLRSGGATVILLGLVYF